MNLRDADERTPALTPEEAAECAARLQAAVFGAIKENDMGDIVRALVEKAKKGDSRAAQTVFALIGSAARMTGPDPKKPTKKLPGTGDKLALLQRRASNGEAIHIPGDRTRSLD